MYATIFLKFKYYAGINLKLKIQGFFNGMTPINIIGTELLNINLIKSNSLHGSETWVEIKNITVPTRVQKLCSNKRYMTQNIRIVKNY